MYERITAERFPSVTRSQFELLRWPGIDGLRPGEIAQLSGLSKQTVNDLLGELERGGYIRRDPHPRDRRARGGSQARTGL
jgi:DNA-binding MarR family transcriptional regulator